MSWNPGDAVVLREIWRGRIWTARPVTVVQDKPEQQMFFMSPGARWMCPSDAHGEWLRLPTDEWALDERVLGWDRVLSFAWPDVAYAVLLFWDDRTNELLRYYVNLQEPLRRTSVGFDYLDHALDVVVAPDRSSVTWKDEDELAEAVRIGIFTPEEAAGFREEGERAIARILNTEPPFDRDWTTWRPDTSWGVPSLPSGWDAV